MCSGKTVRLMSFYLATARLEEEISEEGWKTNSHSEFVVRKQLGH